jgi:outer membrane biosynthesis protein TonB
MKPENPEESYSIQFGKEFPKKEEPKKEPKKIERVKNETKKEKSKKETEKVKKEPEEVKETPARTVEKPSEDGRGVVEESPLSGGPDAHNDISTVRTEIVNAYSYSHYDNALAAIEAEDVVKTLYWISKDFENLKKIISTLEEMKNDSSWREVDE